MAKKNYMNIFWAILALIIIAGGIYFIYEKVNQNNAGAIILSSATPIATPTPTPETIIVQANNYNVGLYFSMTELCSGQSTQGHIDSNINNGMCTIYVKNAESWDIVGTLNLNPAGDFVETINFDNIGTFIYKTVCCDANQNCKMSGEANILVKDCQQQPVEQSGYYTCCESSGVAGCYEGACPAGTTLNGGYEILSQCMNSCAASQPEIPQVGCYDTDWDMGYPDYWTNAGTCYMNGVAHADVCDGNMLREYNCEPLNSPTQCGYTSVNCDANIPGSACVDGRCMVP